MLSTPPGSRLFSRDWKTFCRHRPHPGYHLVLVGLVRIDLERRLKRGEPSRVESYLGRYPELETDREAVLALIVHEQEHRRRLEPNLSFAEFMHRFPSYEAQLAEWFGRARDRSTGPTPRATVDPGNPELRFHAPNEGPAAEAAGTWIGPYKLLQARGEGGMGTVYLAEQQQPVQRRVAVKIIRPGLDSAQILTRFEQEWQALALMDHPNIARILDAGTIPAAPGGLSPGRPFFVMELVDGIPLTKFCDQQRLNLRERLELFVPVCQAVQHAHQKGIIHRDLKPSNVLITL
jgi:hypothetical protein